MRERMREDKAQLREYASQDTASRHAYQDRLVEAWAKKKGLDLGDKLVDLYNDNPTKARNFASILEAQERHLSNLTETQISDTFATTPQNIIKVIRLGWPNSVRGDLFTEFGMNNMKETIYKLAPIYASAQRGTAQGGIIYESTDGERYPTEIEQVEFSGATQAQYAHDGTTPTNGAVALTAVPLRPWTFKVFVNGTQVAVDDGSGRLIGSGLDAGGANVINYTTGAYDFTLASLAGATDDILIEYAYNMEYDTTYESIGGSVEMTLQGFDFRAHPFPIGFSFSHMAALLSEDALKVDAQEALISGGAEALKKALDYLPIKMALRAAGWANAVQFDADFASAGADSDWAHAQSLVGAINQAGDIMYEELSRGGVTALVGGPKAVNYAMKHQKFSADGAQDPIGAHKVGSLNGKDLFKVPSDIVPTNKLLCVFKNTSEDSLDTPVALGSYIPMYRTPVHQYANFQSSGGMAFYGDIKILEKRYLAMVELSNLPA